MNKKKFVFASGLISAMGLVACGENGTTEQITNNYTSGMEIVDLVSSLPKCTADNAGEQYLVKADADVYVCTGKEWKVLAGSNSVDTAYVSDGKFACTTEPLADGSGVNILCNGEVIGTVLNGKDGSDGAAGADGKPGEKGEAGAAGEKGETGAQGIQGEQGVAGADGKDGQNGTDGKDGQDGVGCSIVSQTAESVTIQCGDDKFSMNLNGGSGDIIEEDPGVSLAMLKGVSQKGPYINGASVTLFELDGSKSLMQTGRTFGGEIVSDDGRFSVNNVTLNSSYVRLTANGYYRNEVSGENTTSALTLYAYSDLKRRTSVNINLLTHLEYYRVGYLMGNSDGSLTITAAKKMAQKEIFDQFHISNEGFKNSEDMDVFGSSEGDAALLAISVLLQGSRNVTELTSLLSDFGTKIAEKGEWNDPVTRAKIADWADSVDFGLKDGLTLSKIESNVSGWGLGTVPAFQKYVRNFWYKEYGLGDCNESNANVVKHDTNSKSAYYSRKYAYDGSTDKKVRFICDEKSKLWRRATDIEKDTYKQKCSSEEVGLVISGKVTATNKYYCSTDGWKSLMDWSWEYPKEARMNPEIDYGTMTDNRDGQTYKTVVIGTQTWMAENLNYDYNEGTAKSNCYDNEESNCKVTGRLYLWSAAMDSAAIFSDAGKGCGYGKTCAAASASSATLVRGVCPEGWHLPSNSDWSTLWTAIGGTSTAGTKLKSTSGWNSNGNGTDDYGFSVFPAGYRFISGNFYDVGSYANFWSSAEVNGTYAYYKNFYNGREYVDEHSDLYKNYGFSVRCLKDSP